MAGIGAELTAEGHQQRVCYCHRQQAQLVRRGRAQILIRSTSSRVIASLVRAGSARGASGFLGAAERARQPAVRVVDPARIPASDPLGSARNAVQSTIRGCMPIASPALADNLCRCCDAAAGPRRVAWSRDPTEGSHLRQSFAPKVSRSAERMEPNCGPAVSVIAQPDMEKSCALHP
jgi:hypothetical protein